MHIYGLRYAYSGQVVLDIPDLKIPAGSICGLTGPNGAGKTTLLSLMSGILPLQEGRITPSGPSGLLLQQTALYPEMSGRQNLAYHCALNDVAPGVMDEILDLVRIDPAAADRPVKMLSQGNRQRLLIARAFLTPSDYILLDEPFNAVDVPTVLVMKESIRAFVQLHRKTVIVSSHQLREIEDLITHGVMLKEGRVVHVFDRRLPNGANSTLTIHLVAISDVFIEYLRATGYTFRVTPTSVTLQGLSESQKWQVVLACRDQEVPIVRIDFAATLEDLFLEMTR